MFQSSFLRMRRVTLTLKLWGFYLRPQTFSSGWVHASDTWHHILFLSVHFLLMAGENRWITRVQISWSGLKCLSSYAEFRFYLWTWTKTFRTRNLRTRLGFPAQFKTDFFLRFFLFLFWVGGVSVDYKCPSESEPDHHLLLLLLVTVSSQLLHVTLNLNFSFKTQENISTVY